ncbi:MAG: hypothetical protein MUC56_00390 [Thermoanaerobaculales bacterium]|jgi:hypothetical protein|nr:hypothetical protein [Thermoanaerobaculales bacterium]
MRNRGFGVTGALVVGLMVIAGGLAAAEVGDLSLPQFGGPAAPAPVPWNGSPEGGGRALIDDFNRANGPLGPDWTVQANTFQIVSQAAVGGPGLALATHNTATGDTVEMDIAVDGTNNASYAAAVLNYGAGVTNLFIKIQNNGGTQYNYLGCYTGNNGPSFGLGFYALSQAFTSAHLRVNVDAGRNVTIDLTNVNGGALADQQYVCTGAPAAEGPGIGMGGWNSHSTIDNYADGPIPVELQRFTVE